MGQTSEKENLEKLKDTINVLLTLDTAYYRIKLEWFDRQAEVQKIDSDSLMWLETIRSREPKKHTCIFLNGYLKAFSDQIGTIEMN